MALLEVSLLDEFVEVAEFVPADFEPAFEAYVQVDAVAGQLDVPG